MSDSPRPSEMSLSIKIGEHAVDVAGPIGEVWKVLEVFQRLSGFDPREAERSAERRLQELYIQQMNAVPKQPTYISYDKAAAPYPDPYTDKSALWKALNPDKKKP